MKKKWSDRKVWQWIIHGAIGFVWSFIGSSIIWFGAGVFMSFIVGFLVSVASATMKEATDQTVYDTLQDLLGTKHGHDFCHHLDWHGWSWKDYLQHVVGGFIAPWFNIWLWSIYG